MSILSQPQFHDEEAAFAYLEDAVWGDQPHCPHCGGIERLTRVTPNPEKRIRYGLWRCGDCKRQFTAKIGTVFEHARIPMHKILQGVFLMCSSKKGFSGLRGFRSSVSICHGFRVALYAGRQTIVGRVTWAPLR